ncbi:MAG: hypothetical protein CUN55_09850 [Phototrophicales bacterium]|nr:MAG: hypothetical protein CUN55_09850 [Phototrophicales bacterium]
MTNTIPQLVELYTDRLRLREFVHDDWVAIHRWSQDIEQTRYDSSPNLSEPHARHIVNMIIAYQKESPRLHYHFIIERQHEYHTIGSIYAAIRDKTNHSVEIGYRIATAEWGKGYATEAALLMRDFAVNTMGAKRVFAQVITENARSIRVLEKLGMVCEEVFPNSITRYGQRYDTAVYVYYPPY